MVDDAVVLGLLWEIEEGCREHSCTPHDMSIDVEGDTLAALCRAWLAVQDAPIMQIGGADGLSAFLINHGKSSPRDLQGQRVRIVKEANKEPSNQTQETQKEKDPFDSWFAEHYPDIDKLGKDDPMAAGFRHAMRGSFNSK